MKANTPPDNGHSEEDDGEMEDIDFDMPELGPITIIRKNPAKNTLPDLTESLQDALDKSPEKKTKKKKVSVKNVMRELDEYHINIEKHIEEFHEKVALLAPNGDKINFYQLLPEKNKIEVARNLLLALFLSSKGKISLHQEAHFEDIYIRLEESPEGEYGD